MDELLKALFCRLYLLNILRKVMVLTEECEQHFSIASIKPSEAKRSIRMIRLRIRDWIRKKTSDWHDGNDLLPVDVKASVDRLRSLGEFLEIKVEQPLSAAVSHLQQGQRTPRDLEAITATAHEAFKEFKSNLIDIRDAELAQVQGVLGCSLTEQKPTPTTQTHSKSSARKMWTERLLKLGVLPLFLAGGFQLSNTYYQNQILANSAENSVVLELKRRLEVIRNQCLRLGNFQNVSRVTARLIAVVEGGSHYDGSATSLGKHELGEIIANLGARNRKACLAEALQAAENLRSDISTNASGANSNAIWSSFEILNGYMQTNRLLESTAP